MGDDVFRATSILGLEPVSQRWSGRAVKASGGGNGGREARAVRGAGETARALTHGMEEAGLGGVLGTRRAWPVTSAGYFRVHVAAEVTAANAAGTRRCGTGESCFSLWDGCCEAGAKNSKTLRGIGRHDAMAGARAGAGCEGKPRPSW